MADQLLQSWQISSILAEICERAGVPFDGMDFNALEGAVNGFSMTPDHDAFTGISALATIYHFDVSNFDGMLNFIPRGGDSVVNLTLDDVLEEREGARKQKRLDSMTVPRVMHVQYYDIMGGLNADKQTSDRSLDSRAKSEVKTETTVLMQASQAAQHIAINHKVAIEEQKGEVEFMLSDSFIELTGADIITLEGERLRIDSVQLDEGFQRYKCAHDRRSAYQSTVQGVPVQEPLDPPTLIIGETLFEVIDTKILRDADDILGYYVAVCGATLNWTGAVVEISKDGGQNYIDSAEGLAEAVIGYLDAPVAAHRHEWPDPVNVFRVRLAREDMELESTDRTGMLNRLNLAIVGDELINFSDAEQVEPGVWELTGETLRGRKGTTSVAHAAGTRFVLMERSQLFYVSAELFELNRTLTFKATSFGLSVGTVKSIVFAGVGQTERAPANLKAIKISAATRITWRGAGRLGGGTQVRMGAYFAGYQVTLNGVAQAVQLTSTYDAPAAFTGTVQVRAINTLTGLGPAASITVS